MNYIQKREINNLDEVREIIRDYRRSVMSSITNYIPTSSFYNKWEKEGNILIYKFEDGIYISHDKGFMMDTIFISRQGSDVKEAMRIIKEECGKPVVIERIYREGRDNQIGNPDFILRRMSRCFAKDDICIKPKNVEKAKFEDIESIKKILNVFFNPLTERIPDYEDLENLIKNNGVSIVRDNEIIKGILIFEKDSVNIHLRYWWTSPEYRNKGIGSSLFKDYCYEGRDCKRQFLWVFSDNINAINKYRHYGFEFDGNADEIYVVQ